MNSPQPSKPNIITNPGTSSSLPAGLQKAYDAFVELEQIQDPIRREYELLQAAKLCDLPLDSFRQMFKDYCRQQQEAKWLQSPLTSLLWRTELSLEWLNQSLSQMDFFQVLEYLSKISILVGLILFMIEIPERAEQRVAEQKRTNYEAWRIILASEGKIPSGGRIDALQDLNKQEIPLAGINLEKATLTNVKLPKAQLDGAKLHKTMLNGADLQGAYLTDSDLSEANLRRASLQNAVLFQTNLRKAVLINANLTGAKMSTANLVGANLDKAKLNEVTLEKAIYNSKTVFPSNFDPSQHGAVLLQPGANLQDEDFSGQNLADIDFSQANLRGADLQGANLENANLEQADMRGAKGLNITQIKAAKNWELANYDPSLRKLLGLSSLD